MGQTVGVLPITCQWTHLPSHASGRHSLTHLAMLECFTHRQKCVGNMHGSANSAILFMTPKPGMGGKMNINLSFQTCRFYIKYDKNTFRLITFEAYPFDTSTFVLRWCLRTATSSKNDIEKMSVVFMLGVVDNGHSTCLGVLEGSTQRSFSVAW